MGCGNVVGCVSGVALGLCWKLASDEGWALLELNGDVGGEALAGCGDGRVGSVGGVKVGVAMKIG